MSQAVAPLAREKTIDRRSKLSYKAFVDEYAKRSKPVIITDAMDEWEAKKLWTLEFFQSRYGSMPVIVRRSKQRGKYYRVELGAYIEYLMSEEKEEDPLYLADWEFSAALPELLDHYSVPLFFHNWLQKVPRSIMPPLRWLYIGPATSGTRLHVDIAMTSAWNAVFSGRKRWVFFAPDETPYMYNGEVNAFAPDFETYPLCAKATPWYGIQNPGEIVFTPSGWWHQVINEEGGVSLTENFINQVNYKQALVPYVRTVRRYQKDRLAFQLGGSKGALTTSR